LSILLGDPDSMVSCEVFKPYLTTSGSHRKWEAQFQDKRQHAEGHSENMEYDTLSYVWGDPRDRAVTQVNRKQLPVSKNLWMFLCRHRIKFLATEKASRLFLMDAICIDQKNVEERSKQVAFIADVYKEAKMVFV
jgi:hypothetical protein